MCVPADCYSKVVQLGSTLYNSTTYSPFIFPYAGSTNVLNVNVYVTIFKLLALTNDKILSVAMEVDLSWNDPNIPMNWTGKSFSSELTTNVTSVWTMNLYLKDPASGVVYVQPTSPVYLFSPTSGDYGAFVQTSIVGDFKVTCQGMSLYAFPFDSQICWMTLSYMDTYYPLVNFVYGPSSIVLNSVASSDEWYINNVTYHPSGAAAVTNDSLAKPTFNVIFNLTRNSYYYQVSLIYPTIILQAAVALTFLLPSDHGEKVILGATLILAVYVLQSQLASMLPQFSDKDEPLLVTALMIGFIMTSISLLESVLMQTARIIAPDFPKSFNHAVDKLFQKCCAIVPVLRNQPDVVAKLDVYSTESSGAISMAHSQSLKISRSDLESEAAMSNSAAVGCLSQMLVVMNLILDEQKKRAFFREQAEIKRQHDFTIERAWRRVEYIVNLVALIVYCSLLGYYFGAYIYMKP